MDTTAELTVDSAVNLPGLTYVKNKPHLDLRDVMNSKQNILRHIITLSFLS